MKNQKLLSVILGTIVAASVFAGCKGKGKDDAVTPASTDKSNQALVAAEIEVWHHWGSEQRKPTIEGILNGFNEKYKDQKVTVKGVFVPFDDLPKKLTAAVAAGNPPNVAVQAIEAVGIKAARKQVEDITDYLPKDIKDKYYENYWQTVTYNNRVYALPYNTDTRLLFYNKKLFTEAGISEFPKTWDDFYKIADKLDKKDSAGKYTRLAFLPTIGNFGFDTIALANGGSMFDNLMNPVKPTLNSKQNVEALEWMAKWRDKYGQDTVNAWSKLGSGANDPFISEKVAIFGQVCNYIATLKKYAPNMEYGIAPMPAGPSGKQTAAIGGGFILEVPKGAKNIRESVEFAKFMTDDWATTKWAVEQADVMINKKANEDPALKANKNWQAVIDNMKFTSVTRRHPFAPDAGGTKDKAVDNVLKAGTEKPQKALDAAQADIEKMIKDNEALQK